jgi:lycopene cyclase domain-containing protein
MSAYTVYNLSIAAFIVPASYWLADARSKRRTLALASRIAFLLTLLAYPWDFFAIHLQVWRYPVDPGPRIHDVPLNDLVFMWLCTYLACTLLIAIGKWESSRQGHSKREHASEERAGHDGIRSSRG